MELEIPADEKKNPHTRTKNLNDKFTRAKKKKK